MSVLSKRWAWGSVAAFAWLALWCASGCAASSGDGGATAGGDDGGVDSAASTEVPAQDASLRATIDAAPDPQPVPIIAPLPVLTSLTPDRATVGSAGPSLVVSGAGFVASSVVQIDGAPLTTEFVSANELHAMVPTAKVAAAGALAVAVGTAPPGGGRSAVISFPVENPAPVLTQISPASVGMGATTTPLTVSGSQFVFGATISFDGAALPTTYGSLTRLLTTVPASLLLASGNHAIVVTNPSPGGGPSSSIAFVVTNPTVTVSGVAPTSVLVGAPAQALAVVGSGFIAASALTLNGAKIPCTYVDGAHLTANVPASAFTTVGSFPVVVTNPEPGGGVSPPVMFQVQNPAPTIVSLSPSAAWAGAPATSVTISGTGFSATSQASVNGSAASTTFVDAGHIQTTLSGALLSAAGALSISVANPLPGGGKSSAASFSITNPAPSIATLTPASANVGASSASITILGAGFVFGAAAQIGGTALSTSYTSATQLAVTIPGSLLATAGTLEVTVTNPAPGGGASNEAGFSVGCDTTGVDVVLGAVGTVVTQTLVWDGTVATSERFSASSVCPASIPTAPTDAQPYHAFVVENATGAPITLSTWAVCTSGTNTRSDALLAVYARASVPTAVADRQSCSGAVSEGASGTPSTASPDANGSTWCPGLTKANGYGTTLASCARAVVYIQPWDAASTTYTPPAQIRFEAQ